MRFALIFVMLLAGLAVAGDETKTKKEVKAKNDVKTEQQKTEPKKAEPKKQTPAKVTGGAGMVVNLDGRGQDAPLDPEIQEALANMINTSSEGLKEVELEDGTVIVDLEGRFQSAMVVSIGKDGKMQSNCFSTAPGHKCDKNHVHKDDLKKDVAAKTKQVEGKEVKKKKN